MIAECAATMDFPCTRSSVHTTTCGAMTSPSAPTEVTLEPGVAKSTNPFAWDRTRSSTTTCTGDRPEVSAGGASYHLTVKLGDIESAETKQFLLY